MTTFDKREKSEEARYRRDEELNFRLVARRNKLLGLWAAEKMSLSEDEAGAYAKKLVELQFDRDGDAAVSRKVVYDLVAKGVSMSDAEVQNQMVVCFEEAKTQLAV